MFFIVLLQVLTILGTELLECLHYQLPFKRYDLLFFIFFILCAGSVHTVILNAHKNF